MSDESADATPHYVVVNKRTNLVESGPHPFDKAREKLCEAEKKLRQTQRYTPMKLVLEKVEEVEG